jgi:hypothetical protein
MAIPSRVEPAGTFRIPCSFSDEELLAWEHDGLGKPGGAFLGATNRTHLATSRTSVEPHWPSYSISPLVLYIHVLLHQYSPISSPFWRDISRHNVLPLSFFKERRVAVIRNPPTTRRHFHPLLPHQVSRVLPKRSQRGPPRLRSRNHHPEGSDSRNYHSPKPSSKGVRLVEVTVGGRFLHTQQCLCGSRTRARNCEASTPSRGSNTQTPLSAGLE